MSAYALDERIEQLINTKDTDGIGGLLTVFSMLTNRLTFKVEVDGEERDLTRDELVSCFLSGDAGLRERAYREFGSVLQRESKVLGQIYAHRVRDWHNEQVKLRGYASPIAVRNVSNDVPDRAVEILLDVTEQNATVFHRYFRIKAARLGQERLRRIDLYAPFGEGDRRVEYADAVATVLDTFGSFHPRFAREARRVFDGAHIDSEIRPGKRGGAFCASVLPRYTPWLHVNYTGRLRDVATLAHELGHAIHGMLAADHSVLTFHPSLPLAETASVFAELLVTERLLEREPDRAARQGLLAGALDDIYATVLRQAFFVRFEIDAHPAILENSSTEALCDLYLAEPRASVRLERRGPARVPLRVAGHSAHLLGAVLLLRLQLRPAPGAVALPPLPPGSGGVSRRLSAPARLRRRGAAGEVLREAGIDMTDPAFWQGGFDVVGELIDRLEAKRAPRVGCLGPAPSGAANDIWQAAGRPAFFSGLLAVEALRLEIHRRHQLGVALEDHAALELERRRHLAAIDGELALHQPEAPDRARARPACG